MVQRKPLNLFIGSRIKLAREAAGITQQQLAERINKSTTFVASMETGVYGPSLETIIDLCAALHCSADFLLLEQNHSDDARLLAYQESIRNLSQEEMQIVEKVTRTLINTLRETYNVWQTASESDAETDA